ncbi:MAG: molybdopterin-dependent oxidoreductase [Casimicrobiaceae bacterium]|nr:molybdopterin-dependent oxidoreductase [Casimicrobiaceae bacterium]
MPRSMTRRVFLVGSALVGGALLVGGTVAVHRLSKAARYRPPAAPGEVALSPWFKLTPDNRLVVFVPRQDMGQGVFSMLAMIVAEELDFDWSRVQAEQAPIEPIYANTALLTGNAPAALQGLAEHLARLIGVQMTGGSTSVRDAWGAMRQAAASARAALLEAAASRWSVPVRELAIEQGVVTHAASARRAPLADFAAEAAVRPLPEHASPKPPEAWKLLGKSPPRLDVVEKTLGTARFAIDVRLEGMLYAAIRHIPQVRGELIEVRWREGRPPESVLHQVRGDRWLAVVAKSWWEAERALEQVELVAGGPTATQVSSAGLAAQYRAVLEGEDDPAKLPDLSRPVRRVFEEYGDPDAVLARAPASARLSADYSVPFVAHAAMEPPNCTARIRDGQVEVWVGNQAPTLVQWLAARICGVPREAVSVHTPWLGGGFGGRMELEVVRQALACAKVTGGRPVQLIWSRREDLQHDAYRPAVAARLTATFDAQGKIELWQHEMVGPSVMKSVMGRSSLGLGGDMRPDRTNAEGAIKLAYRFRHFRCRHAQVDVPVPVGFWRSVGYSYNTFFVETFLDEIAAHLKRDPLQLRLELLAESPRHRAVLEAVAAASRWNAPLPGPRWGRGLALAESFKSIVAMVVDVEVIGRTVHLRRVYTAVDCGRALDPANVRAQIAGAAIMGFTAALKPAITLEEGRVVQSNFNDYALMTLAETPTFETVIIDSGAALGGVGEIGVPPAAPALGNAIFAATGQRLRSLPFKLA